jgi:hypothetical protein
MIYNCSIRGERMRIPEMPWLTVVVVGPVLMG